ncbi:hypothetical protein OC846_000352 [Tilletia horrida]|uniref:Cytochrome c oxidase assembly protein COX20, mitochondrial n=1 Tax=Tilletia horrida TaxID=155126 RepID=A0AAN6GVT6_9BASI|nr:hypothetical protein OC846_000352 [Tilletia horrida]
MDAQKHESEKLKAAVQRLSPLDDFKNLGKMPCARSSLLTGMATAAGVIGISAIAGRGLRRALNWGVGSFCAVSLVSWEMCRSSRRSEQARMKVIIDNFPNRAAAKGARQSVPIADSTSTSSSEPPVSRIAPSVTS